jgi:hypothetical protein|tara:strand:- start:73 stop:285 length:213 start_codon:yes stop_codon:yes gene_type:complete
LKSTLPEGIHVLDKPLPTRSSAFHSEALVIPEQTAVDERPMPGGLQWMADKKVDDELDGETIVLASEGEK